MYVDRNIELAYHNTNLIHGKHGVFYIEKPKWNSAALPNKEGAFDIGDVKGRFGRTADIVTRSNIDDWVAYAYASELNSAGYDVRTVTTLPDHTPKGIQISLKNIYIDTDPGFWSLGAIAEVEFNITLVIDGTDVSSFFVKGIHQERGLQLDGEQYGMAARGALTDAIKQSLPELINIIEDY